MKIDDAKKWSQLQSNFPIVEHASKDEWIYENFIGQNITANMQYTSTCLWMSTVYILKWSWNIIYCTIFMPTAFKSKFVFAVFVYLQQGLGTFFL